jgi:hypothetical protein
MFKVLAFALSSCTFVSAAMAADSCVKEMVYPTQLEFPEVEQWAGRGPEAECKMTKKLINYFSVLQDQVGGEEPLKKKLRGTHSKGICLSGAYQASLSSHLKPEQKTLLSSLSLFGASDVRPTQVRFANAASRIRPDWEPDVRALSIKIDLGNGVRQDFAFNNVPRFQIPSLPDFVRVMALQKGLISGEVKVENGQPSILSMFQYFANLNGAVEAAYDLKRLKDVFDLASADSKSIIYYDRQVYWSTTAFALKAPGTSLSRVVKVGAAPCVQFAKEPSVSTLISETAGSEAGAKDFAEQLFARGFTSSKEDYLQENLRTSLSQQPICYDLFVQFLTEEEIYTKTYFPNRRAAQLIEDPSLIWAAPAHKVGRLLINQMFEQETCDRPEHAISVMANSPQVKGIGQINRARDFVETSSWKRR